MLDAETKRRIDTARDILVGKVPDPKSQVEQITIALIYKFMDDMDAGSEEMGGKRTFFAGDFERYGWTKLMAPGLGGYEVLNLYAEALTRMQENPGIPQLFRSIFRNAYLPYRDPETLKMFLKTINEFSYDHSERLGDAFEYLLSVMSSQGDAGQFRTPRHIIDFMVAVVDPQKDERILDPACGTGGFLISAYKHILNANSSPLPDPSPSSGQAPSPSSRQAPSPGSGQVPPPNSTNLGEGKNGKGDLLTPAERTRLMENMRGYDISPDMVRLSLVNMYLHGFPQPQIYEYDTLTSEERWNEYAEVILANPPFMSPKGGIKPHKKFSVQSNRSEVLFVDYMMEHLAPNGRAGIIVPEGIIFQSGNAYKQLRKALVEGGYLWAVVSLPSGVFNPYAGVKTSILLLDRALAKKADQVLFVKLEADGYDLGAQRKPVERNDLPEALEALKAWKETVRGGKEQSQKVFETFTISLLAVSKEHLAEGEEFNLSSERYKEIKNTQKHKFPVVNLGEVSLIISGQSPEGKYYNSVGDGLPFYQGKTEFTEKYLGIPVKWTTQVTKVAEKDDILMSVRAPVGPVNIATQKICIGRGLAAIRPTKSKMLVDFLFTYLKIKEPELIGSSGAVFASINHKEIEKIKIPLPPMDVQKEIVAEIEGYQKIIDGARQVVEAWKPNLELELREELKKAGREAWEVVKLGDVCEIKGGKRLPKGEAFANGKTDHPYIRVVDMEKGSINFSSLRFISQRIHDEIKNYTIAKDDVYISIAGTIGLFGTVPDELDGANLTENAAKIITNKQIIDKDFLKFIGNSRIVQDQIKKLTHAVGVPKLALERIRSIEIPIPPIGLQISIVEHIKSEENAVEENIKLINIYEAKKQKAIEQVWEE